MPRTIECLVSIPAMQNNLSVIRDHLDAYQQKARIWAVIKANAYGHGIERAVKGFQAADGLAMLDLEEAIRCRQLGWKKPILLLEGFFEPEDLAVLQEYDLQTAIHSDYQLEMIAATTLTRPLSVWLKMNSGMNRLGFAPQHYAKAYGVVQQLQAERKIAEVGWMTHFANADGTVGIQEPLQRFQSTISPLPRLPINVANSATTWRYPSIEQDWVRTGILLYGSSPFTHTSAHDMQLQATMHLHAKIIAIQALAAGDSVGYGSQFVAPEPMRIGVVACGYADGYPRIAPMGTPVAVAGKRSQIVGRVSMDMLTIDLRPLPHARIGDVVELWGDTVSIDDVATSCQTIAYELMTAVTARVPMRTI